MPEIVTDLEKQVDAILQQERAARDEEARGVVRARLAEQERLAREAEERAKAAAARAAFLERARVAHKQACTEYKDAVDAFRAARIRLHALDSILGRGGFGAHQLGVELRHSSAAPSEGDLHDGYRAAEDSIRKTLGG
jgi:chromosome condensin MukBEF ATPase and DNA-binding subunit MukB